LASDIALILANLVPLVGVLFRGWDVSWVLYTYWLENVVVGLFAASRILLAKGQAPLSPPRRSWISGLGKFLYFENFLFVYGGFMIGHRLFLMMLFEPVRWPFEPLSPENIQRFFLGDPAFPRADLVVAVLSLFVSHGLSFVRNFIMRGEFQVSNYQLEASRPVKRVMGMQLTIIVGGFLANMLGAPPAAIAVMVAAKILFDLFLHIRSHKMNLVVGG
jgi:hypothetical protein